MVSQLVTFAPGQTNAFVLLTSNNDNIVEFNEFLTTRVTLESTDIAVTITEDKYFVTIEDSDGELIINIVNVMYLFYLFDCYVYP